MNGPIVLLADEPTGNLDPDLTSEIIELFKSINARGTTVIVATHDPNVLAQVNRRVITLDHGKLVSMNRRLHEKPPVSPAGGAGQRVDEPDDDGGGGGDHCLHLCMRGSFLLLYVNLRAMALSLEQDIQVMVYLQDDVTGQVRSEIENS